MGILRCFWLRVWLVHTESTPFLKLIFKKNVKLFLYVDTIVYISCMIKGTIHFKADCGADRCILTLDENDWVTVQGDNDLTVGDDVMSESHPLRNCMDTVLWVLTAEYKGFAYPPAEAWEEIQNAFFERNAGPEDDEDEGDLW